MMTGSRWRKALGAGALGIFLALAGGTSIAQGAAAAAPLKIGIIGTGAIGGPARAREFDVGTSVYTRVLTARQLRRALQLRE